MTELAHHIEILLLDNDCVVVPELGGFVTHYAPARRVDRGSIFLPPTRTIGFNPQLKMNDGLLVQSYMKKHNTSFPDATQLIKKEVEELVACLHEKRKAGLPNVGEIHYTPHNTYEFTPCNPIATPHLFGLEPFEMKQLSELDKKDSATKPSGILLPFLRYAVSTAAVIFIFLFLSPPVENTTIEERNYAQLFHSDIFTHSLTLAPVTLNKQAEDKSTVTPQTLPAATATTENKETVVIEEPVSEPIVEESKEEVKPKTTAPKAKKTNSVKTKRYHIITLAGNLQATQKNLNTLKQEGYPHAKMMNIDGQKCISVMSFSTEEDAYRKLLLFRRAKTYKNSRIVPIRS
jgi:hypothetical protein